MTILTIRFDTLKDISKFVNIVGEHEGTIEISRGRYRIDGKSIIGILGLPIQEELEVYIQQPSKLILDKLEDFKTR